MTDPRQSYPRETLARFHAAADAAVEQGRRAAGEARDRGLTVDRRTPEITERPPGGGGDRRSEDPRPKDPRLGDPCPEGERRTPADLRAAARQYRMRAGLPVPDLPTGGGPPGAEVGGRAVPPQAEDEDFSQDRIMRKI
jgi:hypothetical protein